MLAYLIEGGYGYMTLKMQGDFHDMNLVCRTWALNSYL